MKHFCAIRLLALATCIGPSSVLAVERSSAPSDFTLGLDTTFGYSAVNRFHELINVSVEYDLTPDFSFGLMAIGNISGREGFVDSTLGPSVTYRFWRPSDRLTLATGGTLQFLSGSAGFSNPIAHGNLELQYRVSEQLSVGPKASLSLDGHGHAGYELGGELRVGF